MVAESLLPWQQVNVTGHLAIGFGALTKDQVVGREELRDASGIIHHGISRYGLVVKVAPSQVLKQTIAEARHHKVVCTHDFPRAMLETAHDDELAVQLEATRESDIEYLGVLLFGPTVMVQLLTKSAKLLA